MLWNAFILAIREIKRNILRSSLTSLGIVIGVAAVITMVTLGNGATRKVKEEIVSLGANLLQIKPGQRPRHFGVREMAKPFKMKDAEAISREIYGIEAVAPTAGTITQVIYGNKIGPALLLEAPMDF